MKTRNALRNRRKFAIRAKVRGTEGRPRLTVFRSNTMMYVQVIDDQKAKTLLEGSIKGKNMESAQKLGDEIAKKILKKNITAVVFDRAGFRYHGNIKILAEALRTGGIIL